jgi:hypothetical protein
VKKSLANTTLYLRDIPKALVRALKAQAALRGMTLTDVVVETLSRSVGDDGLATLRPLEPDMKWYEAHKSKLLRRYRGEHLAILNKRVLDHDENFDVLARRVFATIGVRSIFMPLCVDPEPVFHFRSPQIVGP